MTPSGLPEGGKAGFPPANAPFMLALSLQSYPDRELGAARDMATGKILLVIGIALASGCATSARTHVRVHEIVDLQQARPDAPILVPAAQVSTALPWAPTPIPEGSIRVNGPFGEALNVATRLHRQLNAIGVEHRVICRRAIDGTASHAIRVEVPAAADGSIARLALLQRSRALARR
jgi:hypothetical protein